MEYKCPVCGNRVFEGEKYCSACGTDVELNKVISEELTQNIQKNQSNTTFNTQSNVGAGNNSVNSGVKHTNLNNRVITNITQGMPGKAQTHGAYGGNSNNTDDTSRTTGIASIICGGLSIYLSLMGLATPALIVFAIILGIAGLITSNISSKTGDWKYARVGRTLSIIGTCLPFAVLIIVIGLACSLSRLFFAF